MHNAREMAFTSKVSCLMAILLIPLSCALGQDAHSVVVTPEQSARAAYQALFLYSVAKQHSYQDFILMKYAVDAFTRNPNENPARVIKFLNDTTAFYTAKHQADIQGSGTSKGALEDMQSMLTIMGEMEGGKTKTYLTIGQELLKMGTRGYDSYVHDNPRITGQGFSAPDNDQAWEVAKKYSGEAFTLAQTNQGFKLAFDSYFGAKYNVLSSDSYDAILMKNPDFATATRVAELTRTANGLSTDLQSLRKEFAAVTKQLLSEIAEERAALRDLSRKQDSLIASIAQHEIDEQKQKERELLADGARAGFFLLSAFAELGGNKQLAHQISVVGDSTVKVAQALDNFSRANYEPQTAQAAASSLILASSVVGAAIAIASLASEAQSPDEVIQQQVIALSKQIAQLSADMHTRFDQVELGLNAIFHAVNDSFRDLEHLQRITLVEVEGTRADVDQVHLRLVNLASRIDALHFETQQYLQAGFDREFKKSALECTQHGTFFPTQPMSAEQFSSCQLDFVIHATEESKDAVSVGVIGAIDEQAVADNLTQRPLTENLNYVAALASERFGKRELREYVGNIASLSEWKAGAEAYISLTVNHPEFGKIGSIQSTDRLISVGEQLRTVMRSTRDEKLLLMLLENYRKRLNDFYGYIASLEKNYRTTYAQGYAFWQGPEQSTNYKARLITATTMESCSSRPAVTGWSTPPGNLALPPNTSKGIPSRYLIAEDLSLGEVAMCFSLLDFSAANSRHVRSFDKLPGFPERYYDLLYEHLTVKVQASFRVKSTGEELPIFEQTVQGKEILWAKQFDDGHKERPGGSTSPDWSELIPILQQNWTAGENLQIKLDQQIVADAGKPPNDAQAKSNQKIGALVDKSLRDVGRTFFLKVADGSIDRTGLDTVGKFLDGSKAAIDAFISIALTSELNSDDGFRGVLFGKERLLDSREVRFAYLDATRPHFLKNLDARDELTSLGFDFGCSSFFDQIRQRNWAIVLKFIDAGIASELNGVDFGAAKVLLSATTTKAGRRMLTPFVKSRTQNEDRTLDRYPDDLVVHKLTERAQFLENKIRVAFDMHTIPSYPSIDSTLWGLRMLRTIQAGVETKNTGGDTSMKSSSN